MWFWSGAAGLWQVWGDSGALLCSFSHHCVCCCTALQNSTGQSVTYLTGGIIATRAMQDAVKLIIKGLAYQERAGCRVPAMNIGTG